jgi:hypothetical protein
MHFSSGKRGEIHRIRLESDLVDAAWLDDKLRRISLDRERYHAMLAVQDELTSVLSERVVEHVLRGLEREHLVRPIAHGGRPATWQLTWAGIGMLEAIENWLRNPPHPKPGHHAQLLQMPHAVSKSA